MEQVTAFKTSDGALFSIPNECQLHEISLVWRSHINEFLESEINPYPAKGHAPAYRKVIIAWEQFKTIIMNNSDADPL